MQAFVKPAHRPLAIYSAVIAAAIKAGRCSIWYAAFSVLPFATVLAESAGEEPSPIVFDAFLDTYFANDSNHLDRRQRAYTTQAYYEDEPQLNLGAIGASYNGDTLHGRIAAQYGSSVISNYAAEPDLAWRYLQEAYAGVKLADDLWFDAGIYFSHIGLESWISRDNWTYTRSLIAEYSPYYQLGGRLSYKYSDALSMQLHLLNGWQNISDSRDPAIGTQVAWNVNDNLSLTHNTFIGNEHGTRIFNDLVLKLRLNDAWALAGAADVGNQQLNDSSGDAWWHGFALIAQYKPLQDLATALRVERYSDPHQVLLAGESGERVSVWGVSVNADLTLAPNLIWRNECRYLSATNPVFPDRNSYDKDDVLLVSSLSFSISSAGS